MFNSSWANGPLSLFSESAASPVRSLGMGTPGSYAGVSQLVPPLVCPAVPHAVFQSELFPPILPGGGQSSPQISGSGCVAYWPLYGGGQDPAGPKPGLWADSDGIGGGAGWWGQARQGPAGARC